MFLPSRDGSGEASADAVVSVDDHLSCDAVVTQRVLVGEGPGVDAGDVGKDDVVLVVTAAVRVDLGDDHEVLLALVAEETVEHDDVAVDGAGGCITQGEVCFLCGAAIDADAALSVTLWCLFYGCLLDVLQTTKLEVSPCGLLQPDVPADARRTKQLVEIDLDLSRADVAERSQWLVGSGHCFPPVVPMVLVIIIPGSSLKRHKVV